MADAVLEKAVDAAREAAVAVAGDPDAVAQHLESRGIDERVVAHAFACALSGYRGWVWEVTVARVPRGAQATVCEAHLVPADDALLAPPWVPYAERVRPGDMEPSMVLPFIAEDPRLVPGYAVTDDEEEDGVAVWELGLGRERVLGPSGRDEAAERWHRGTHGPAAPSALASTEACATCGFLVPLGGSLRGMFGVCANEWSPSDGQVVSLDHGCGAHSQTDVEKQVARWPADDPVIDTMAVHPVDLSEDGEVVATGDGEPDAPARPPEDETTAE